VAYDPALIWQINTTVYEQFAHFSPGYMGEKSTENVFSDVRNG